MNAAERYVRGEPVTGSEILAACRRFAERKFRAAKRKRREQRDRSERKAYAEAKA